VDEDDYSREEQKPFDVEIIQPGELAVLFALLPSPSLCADADHEQKTLLYGVLDAFNKTWIVNYSRYTGGFLYGGNFNDDISFLSSLNYGMRLFYFPLDEILVSELLQYMFVFFNKYKSIQAKRMIATFLCRFHVEIPLPKSMQSVVHFLMDMLRPSHPAPFSKEEKQTSTGVLRTLIVLTSYVAENKDLVINSVHFPTLLPFLNAGDHMAFQLFTALSRTPTAEQKIRLLCLPGFLPTATAFLADRLFAKGQLQSETHLPLPAETRESKRGEMINESKESLSVKEFENLTQLIQTLASCCLVHSRYVDEVTRRDYDVVSISTKAIETLKEHNVPALVCCVLTDLVPTFSSKWSHLKLMYCVLHDILAVLFIKKMLTQDVERISESDGNGNDNSSYSSSTSSPSPSPSLSPSLSSSHPPSPFPTAEAIIRVLDFLLGNLRHNGTIRKETLCVCFIFF
jgi:hypothetical protein